MTELTKEQRVEAVRVGYANIIRHYRNVEMISQDCSDDINDHYKARGRDWLVIGQSLSLTYLVGEYKGLTQ